MEYAQATNIRHNGVKWKWTIGVNEYEISSQNADLNLNAIYLHAEQKITGISI